MFKNLFNSLILISIATGWTIAQGQPGNGNVQPPGLIGSSAGNGLWPAVAQSRADLRTHTLYRPEILPDDSLPVLLWGNGGCNDNGLSHSYFLREVASHSYLVVALGYAKNEQLLEGEAPRPAPSIGTGSPPVQGPDATNVEQHIYALDWLVARNADPLDELYGHVDLNHIAVAGHSCGGLQAIKISADSRIDTSMIFNSGVYNSGRGRSGVNVSKDELKNLHGPIVYITGGPTDIAHENSKDDVARIDHVPVFFGWLPVGHGGTFLKALDGAEWGEVAVHWLDWQLKGDEVAGLWFTESNCVLCQQPEWTVESYITGNR